MDERDGAVRPGERRCHDCSKVKPITSFSKVRGIRTDICVICSAVRVREGICPPALGASRRH